MICPECKKNKTSIISSKFEKYANLVKRKRYCICGNLFSTYEKFEKIRKKRKPRSDTIWKNERIIKYANRRITAAIIAIRKAYKIVFKLKSHIDSKASANKIKNLLKHCECADKKGKSYLTLVTKKGKRHKFNIEGKKQSIRIIVNNPLYWADKWYLFKDYYDAPRTFAERTDKKYKVPNPYTNQAPEIKENWLDKDKKRKEVDEYYKSVCSYIKDEQYNQDFFVQNDEVMSEFWKIASVWESYLGLR